MEELINMLGQNFGWRCFAVSAPLAWNRLPPEIRIAGIFQVSTKDSSVQLH